MSFLKTWKAAVAIILMGLTLGSIVYAYGPSTRSESVYWMFINGVRAGMKPKGDGTFKPLTQTLIAAGSVQATDFCGGMVPITAAGAISLSTTHSIEATSAMNAGCVLYVRNVGANTITFVESADMLLSGAGNLALAQNQTVIFVNDGTEWIQWTAVLTPS